MADERLTDKTELQETPNINDFIHVVDVSDTTGSLDGTSKKVRFSYFFRGTKETYSAIAGQTDFQITGSPPADRFALYRGRVFQIEDTDYTYAGGIATFSEPCDAGEIITKLPL
jgi:hypothetical protein